MIVEGDRLLDGILLVDAGAEPSARLARLPAVAPGDPVRGVCTYRVDAAQFSISDMEQLAERLRAPGMPPVCCRFSGPCREPGNTLARHCAAPLILIVADADRLDAWAEQAQVHRQSVKTAAGLLVIGEAARFLP